MVVEPTLPLKVSRIGVVVASANIAGATALDTETRT
jgi:hypothetical protein